jgi:hypothetical protein
MFLASVTPEIIMAPESHGALLPPDLADIHTDTEKTQRDEVTFTIVVKKSIRKGRKSEGEKDQCLRTVTVTP